MVLHHLEPLTGSHHFHSEAVDRWDHFHDHAGRSLEEVPEEVLQTGHQVPEVPETHWGIPAPHGRLAIPQLLHLLATEEQAKVRVLDGPETPQAEVPNLSLVLPCS